MKIPIIIYNDKFLDRMSILMNVGGTTLFPFIILREHYKSQEILKNRITLNHEKIHIEQQKELLVVFFYLFYFLEYFIKLFKYGQDAYYNLSFERESYVNGSNLEYLKTRKRYSFLKYIFNEK